MCWQWRPSSAAPAQGHTRADAPGVILSAPVPNSISTYSSPITWAAEGGGERLGKRKREHVGSARGQIAEGGERAARANLQIPAFAVKKL